jgi:hypothetical protein
VAYRLPYVVELPWVCLRIILQEVAIQRLVFEERRCYDGKLRLGARRLSHHDEESDNDGQEEEGRSELPLDPHVDLQ